MASIPKSKKYKDVEFFIFREQSHEYLKDQSVESWIFGVD